MFRKYPSVCLMRVVKIPAKSKRRVFYVKRGNEWILHGAGCGNGFFQKESGKVMTAQIKSERKGTIKRKRVTGCLCAALIVLLYATGKRYVFPTVERNAEEAAVVPEGVHTDPVIEINRQETGEGEDKITYFVADIQLGDATDLKTAFAKDQYGLNIKEHVSNIAQDNQALFAVNGDFYGYRTDGIVIRDGVLYRDEPTGRACLVMYRDGTVNVMQEGTVSGEELVEEGAWNVFSFGPTLVENGRICEGMEESYKVDLIGKNISGKQPRTGIGILGENHLLIITVDGRAKGYSCGMTFQEFAQLFIDYGCELAYNLDGGSSVTMYYDGQVLNQPSSGSEREVSDIIYISKGQQEGGESGKETESCQ